MSQTRAGNAGGRWVLRATVVLVPLLLHIQPGIAIAALDGFVPSSRRGTAEVWGEFPRYVEPLGDDYVGDYGIDGGWGFGFGAVFGLADNVCLEGRVLQTNHTAGDLKWDLDLAQVGLKYCFIGRSPFQPFLSAGYVRQNLESDATQPTVGEYVRLTGHGFVVSLGVDYYRTQKFFFTIRGDYSVVDYGYAIFGSDEQDLAETLDGRVISVSLGVGYRAPVW